jgi:hypothetical protein
MVAKGTFRFLFGVNVSGNAKIGFCVKRRQEAGGRRRKRLSNSFGNVSLFIGGYVALSPASCLRRSRFLHYRLH